MTRLFNIDTTKLDDGVYTFRLIGYTQTGVDGDGNPILEPVDMGLANGVCKRCGGTEAPDISALLTLLTANTLRRPTCEIVSMKKNGTQLIDECEILVLDDTDFVSIEFEVSNESPDPGVEDGNLERYGLWLERGTGPETNLLGIAPPDVVVTPGSPGIQDGPTYPLALTQGATAPYWYGGTWTVDVKTSVFNALGGSCAFNLTLRSWNRQTNGWNAGHGWGAVRCSTDRAFTAILAADKALYCAQLGCE